MTTPRSLAEKLLQDTYFPFLESKYDLFAAFIEKQHPQHFLSLLAVTYQKIIQRTQIEWEDKCIQEEWNDLENELAARVRDATEKSLKRRNPSSRPSPTRLSSSSSLKTLGSSTSKLLSSLQISYSQEYKIMEHAFHTMIDKTFIKNAIPQSHEESRENQDLEIIQDVFRKKFLKITSGHTFKNAQMTESMNHISRYIFDSLLVPDIYHALKAVDYEHEKDLLGEFKNIIHSVGDFSKFYDSALEKQIPFQQIRFLYSKRREALMYFFGILLTTFQRIVLRNNITFKPFQCQKCQKAYCWEDKVHQCVKCKTVVYCSQKCLQDDWNSHKLKCIEATYRRSFRHRQELVGKVTNSQELQSNSNNKSNAHSGNNQNGGLFTPNKFFKFSTLFKWKLHSTVSAFLRKYYIVVFIFLITIVLYCIYLRISSMPIGPFIQAGSWKWWKIYVLQRVYNSDSFAFIKKLNK